MSLAELQLTDEFRDNIANFHAHGSVWLQALPARVQALAERWRLSDVRAMPRLTFNFVAHAQRDAQAVVLKVSPVRSALAKELGWLRRHRVDSVIAVLEHTEDAYLMPRLTPGESLREALADANPPTDEAATRLLGKAIQRSTQTPAQAGFPSVADWFEGGWADYLARFDHPGPLADVERVRRVAQELLANAAPARLLHGDLHHGNLLRSSARWVISDPHGVNGEPAHECAAALRNCLPSDVETVIDRRVAILGELLSIDRQRIAGWGYAQTQLAQAWSLVAEAATAEAAEPDRETQRAAAALYRIFSRG